jgi:dipeptidase E
LMKKRKFLERTAIASVGLSLLGSTQIPAQAKPQAIKKIFFLTGGRCDLTTIKYLISLTEKENPKICFLPTPMGDSEAYINKWFEVAKALPIQPFVQKVVISNEEQKNSFEETLLQMDAILVTGGNTLNAISL